jgi:hypothetical protein
MGNGHTQDMMVQAQKCKALSLTNPKVKLNALHFSPTLE